MLGSLCDAALIQVVFSASPPRSDPSFCRGYKKMLHKESNRNLMPKDPTEIGAENRPTDDEFFCISVGCFTCERWDGCGGVIGRASHMVILGFAFPLETRVVVWTSRKAITASEGTKPRSTEHQWRHFKLESLVGSTHDVSNTQQPIWPLFSNGSFWLSSFIR